MHIIFCCNLRNIPPEKVTPSSESFPSRHLAYPFRPHLFENPIQYPAPYKKGALPTKPWSAKSQAVLRSRGEKAK